MDSEAELFKLLAPYAVSLVALVLLIKLTGREVGDLIELVFREIRSLIALRPNRKSTNMLGTIGLFCLVILLLAHSSLEFALGKLNAPSTPTADYEVLHAVLVFFFGAVFILSVMIAND